MWNIVHEDIPCYSSIKVAKVVIGIISTHSHTINNRQYLHPQHQCNFCKGPRLRHNPSEQVRIRSSSPSRPLSHTSCWEHVHIPIDCLLDRFLPLIRWKKVVCNISSRDGPGVRCRDLLKKMLLLSWKRRHSKMLEWIRGDSPLPSTPGHPMIISLKEVSPSALSDDNIPQTCASFIQYSDKKLRSLQKIRRPPTSSDDLGS
jgi:hypothetical protein